MIINVKYMIFILVLVNLMTVSCQSKSEEINLNILNESSKNVIGNKQTYPLKYRDFVDSLHTRVVLQENYIQDKWQPFVNNELKLNYMDVYFNKEKIIGFKGSFEANSENQAENLYTKLLNNFSSDKAFKKIVLNSIDPNLKFNEWESNNLIVGTKYEKPNNSVSIIVIYKNELSSFYDKIFYSEFLNLTQFRDSNSQIKFKELKVSPAKDDKNFYKEKFKELKNEYNKK